MVPTSPYGPPRKRSHAAKAAAPPATLPSGATQRTSVVARSAVVPSAARSVNCQGTSRTSGPSARCSRVATQVALVVQNAQSPSYTSQGRSRRRMSSTGPAYGGRRTGDPA